MKSFVKYLLVGLFVSFNALAMDDVKSLIALRVTQKHPLLSQIAVESLNPGYIGVQQAIQNIPSQQLVQSLKDLQTVNPSHLSKSKNPQWSAMVQSCPIDTFINLTKKNHALLQDEAVKKRFLAIETKERWGLSSEDLKYVTTAAEKIRYGYDYDVTFEWSWRNASFSYLIKNTGIDNSKINDGKVVKVAATSSENLPIKHLCDHLACVPYHKYGPMPTGSLQEWNAAIMNRANLYYRERGISLRITSSTHENGVTNFTFTKSRATPAQVIFMPANTVKATFNDSDAASSSTHTEPSSYNNAKLTPLDHLFSDNQINIPLVSSSSSQSEDPAIVALAEQRATQIRSEAEKLANEQLQNTAQSYTKFQVKQDVQEHIDSVATRNDRRQELAQASSIANAVQHIHGEKRHEVGGHRAPEYMTGTLPSDWELAIGRLPDDKFIEHYKVNSQMREFNAFRDRLKAIIQRAGIGDLKVLIRDDLDNNTIIQNLDVLGQRAHEIGLGEYFDGHITAMHERISRKPWFALNPIAPIDEKDQPALISYYTYMQGRHKTRASIDSIIKNAQQNISIDYHDQCRILSALRRYGTDPIFNRNLKDKNYDKCFYGLASRIRNHRMIKYTQGTQGFLHHKLEVDRDNKLLHGTIDTQSAVYKKLSELADKESLELTGLSTSQLQILSKRRDIPLEQLVQKYTNPLQQNLHKAIIKSVAVIPKDYTYAASTNSLARAALKLNKLNKTDKAGAICNYLKVLGATLIETDIAIIHAAFSLPELASKAIETLTDKTLDIADAVYGLIENRERYFIDRYAPNGMMVIADLHKGEYKAARKFAKGIGYAGAKLVREPHMLSYDIVVGTGEAIYNVITKTGKLIRNEGLLQVARDTEHIFPKWSKAVVQEYMDSEDTVYALARAAAKMSAEEWGETIGDTVIAYYSGKYIHNKTQPIFKKIYNAATTSAAAKTFADFKKAFKAKLKAKLDKLWPTTAKNGINEAFAENIAQDQSIFKQVVDEFEYAVNQSGEVILKNGYYEVNGFKFTEYYYKKLYNRGRKAPSLIARQILEESLSISPDLNYPGFFRYELNGWEMFYNPDSKIIAHLGPIKNK